MESRYHKLLNLFALTLLAFAIYLNFFRSDPEVNPNPQNTGGLSRAVSNQPKQTVGIENSKPSRVKKIE